MCASGIVAAVAPYLKLKYDQRKTQENTIQQGSRAPRAAHAGSKPEAAAASR